MKPDILIPAEGKKRAFRVQLNHLSIIVDDVFARRLNEENCIYFISN